MITLEQIKNKVIELANNSPENVYTGVAIPRKVLASCSYVAGDCSDGTKGCIFGQALIALGIPKTFFTGDFETDTIQDILRELNRTHKVSLKDPNSECLLYKFTEVQERQDNEETWQESIEPFA